MSCVVNTVELRDFCQYDGYDNNNNMTNTMGWPPSAVCDLSHRLTYGYDNRGNSFHQIIMGLQPLWWLP
jgi:hypothetical protein